MPVRSRRTRLTASQRREEILAAAMAVFGERGYHGSSIDEIAQAAGISKALIYEHFASKKDLHASLLERYAGDLFARLEANAATGATGEERLRGGIAAFFGFVEEHRGAFRVLLRDLNEAEVVEALRGVNEQAVGVVATLLSTEPVGPEIEMIAVQLSGALQSLANWWGEHRDVPRDVLIESAMRFAWVGLERLGERAPAS